jgi:TPR repeat protein
MARLEFAALDVTEGMAQGGATDALFELGLKHCAGRDVEVNLVEAHKWFNLAASRGNVDARRYRTELASEMTKLQVAEAQKLAREWLRLH